MKRLLLSLVILTLAFSAFTTTRTGRDRTGDSRPGDDYIGDDLTLDDLHNGRSVLAAKPGGKSYIGARHQKTSRLFRAM